MSNDHRKAQGAVQSAQDRVSKLHSILTRLGAKKIPKLNEIIKKEPPTPRYVMHNYKIPCVLLLLFYYYYQ